MSNRSKIQHPSLGCTQSKGNSYTSRAEIVFHCEEEIQRDLADEDCPLMF